MRAFALRFAAPMREPQVVKLRADLSVWLEAADFPGDAAYRAVTVVDELFCNTMEHSQATWAEVKAETSGSSVAFTLKDDGIAFDPHKAAMKDYAVYLAGDPDRRLGLYLVSRLAREVKYSREGSVNEVHFLVDPNPPELLPLRNSRRKK